MEVQASQRSFAPQTRQSAAPAGSLGPTDLEKTTMESVNRLVKSAARASDVEGVVVPHKLHVDLDKLHAVVPPTPFEVALYNCASDGKVGEFEQGTDGDCWFLSTLNALSQDKEGQKVISGAIAWTGPGVYEVTFGKEAGGDNVHTYTVTADEVNEAREKGVDLGNGMRSGKISNGDFDVALLEVAAIKYYQSVKPSTPHEPNANPMIGGDWGTDALSLLTGYNGAEIDSISSLHTNQLSKSDLDALAKDPDGLTMTMALQVASSKVDEFGNRAEFAHEYAVTAIDSKNQTVTVENPWKTNAPIVLSYGQFLGVDPLSEGQQEALRGNNEQYDMTYIHPIMSVDNPDLGENPAPPPPPVSGMAALLGGVLGSKVDGPDSGLRSNDA